MIRSHGAPPYCAALHRITDAHPSTSFSTCSATASTFAKSPGALSANSIPPRSPNQSVSSIQCGECHHRIEDGEEKSWYKINGRATMDLGFASEKLKIGESYSRNSLTKQFHITDATLNTGVFRPKGYSSVW